MFLIVWRTYTTKTMILCLKMFYNIGPRSPVALKKKLERDLMMKLIMHAPKGCDSKTFFVVFYNLAQKLLA
jgi:hypothetical protein